METVAITATPKGHRVWLQGLTGKGITLPFVRVAYGVDTIALLFVATPEKGARKVTQTKGGIVDLQSNKVTQWAQGSTLARVSVNSTTQVITITRAN